MRKFFTMNAQNKLKIGIGTAAILLIAFYTYCLFIYSGEYLGGIEYKRRKIAVTDGKNSAEILIDPVNQYDF